MSGPFAEPPPRRRLSIAHLMLWTLGCALALGFYRSIELEQQRPDDRFSLILQYFGLPYCIPAGARVGAVFLFGWMTWRGDKSFPTQPGHWLLLIEGTSILLTWLGQAVAFLAVGDQARNISYSSAAEVPSCIVSAILYAVALQKLSG